ncbi:condensation domain-containing protein [uncultured Algibacter sp.]|uniref:condensation domain-containing protein n=1 Tax=uncultured Algibacter sp. TaxID=298659 RepID=UPI00261450A9|nr:condensation domain-containing protein [uncultured Algibacter sp.]
MTKDNLRHKLEQLSDNERQLLAIKVKELHTNIQISNSTTQKKIVAYVKGDSYLDKDDLKTYLRAKLPDYMIPSTINVLKDIPLLPNGKVDKKGLLKTKDQASFSEANKNGIVNPKNDIETKLVQIWEEVLGFSPISTNDNFFEIGGDSILSIQIVAKARKEGVHLKANQLFENQTIGELALFASTLADANLNNTNNKVLEGETPLTPVQHWFFETHKNAPHFWNQVVELQNISDVDSKTFETISKQIITNHEALRLSFKQENNNWQALIKSSDAIESFYHYNLDNVDTIDAQDKKIKDILLKLQERAKLSEGNLFKMIFFDCNHIQSNKIILIGHHLIVDLVSWNIITNEIAQIIKNKSENFIIDTGNNKTGTIKDWSDYLEKRIDKNLISDELNYWTSQISDNIEFPTDLVSNAKTFYENSIISHTSKLDSEYTNNLVFKANEPYNTKVEDLLIATIISTLCEWGSLEKVLLGLERQGRNVDNLSLDVSSTVGWFTSFFPILLGYNNSTDIGNHIKFIKEKLRAIPNNGLGFGILKYLSDENTSILNQLQPKVVFNYLGKSNTESKNKAFSFNFLESPTRAPLSERNYAIEINAQIINDNLLVNWSFTKDLYKEETAKIVADKFIQNLKATIDYCITQNDVSYTPSDFPEANLNQDDLDNLLGQF